MPLSKGLTFQDFADEPDRAKRTLVRKQDNLAGGNRQPQPLSCAVSEPGYVRGATAVRIVTNSSAAVG